MFSLPSFEMAIRDIDLRDTTCFFRLQSSDRTSRDS
ncbi:hypothetical protein HALLA_16965 [Halostagnicola larsenii XH-48]|uniref:Uncharacterized protein n=1 Tax=Halostagnicola larsenii XH-48 TaxID=797299 RepID=W0JUS9_9EURY|nr:hypothetical protein HALLA_16965 [Halostagnicola larsenii XH-48]